MSTLNHIAERIIKEQEFIIGPLAWSEAKKVSGLQIDVANKAVVIASGSDEKVVVDALVAQYERLFGRASHEACRDAVASLIAGMPASDVPSSLRV